MLKDAFHGIEYYNNLAATSLARVSEIGAKLYAVPYSPLSIEETYAIRNALLHLQVAQEGIARNTAALRPTLATRFARLKLLTKKNDLHKPQN